MAVDCVSDLQKGGASAFNPYHVSMIIDGGGSAITTGVKGDLRMPFTGTITGWEIVADQAGAISIDVWKDTYANFPPTDADSITASAPIAIPATNAKAQDSTLTGWNTGKNITAGDYLRFNVDSVTTITRVTITIYISRP